MHLPVKWFVLSLSLSRFCLNNTRVPEIGSQNLSYAASSLALLTHDSRRKKEEKSREEF